MLHLLFQAKNAQRSVRPTIIELTAASLSFAVFGGFPPNFSLKNPLSRLWADWPTDLWAIQPTGREITDFKKPVSVRVKK